MKQVKPGVLQLVPVCSEHFTHKVFTEEEECTVLEFCKQNNLNIAAFNIFLDYEHLPDPEWMSLKDQLPHDVILMDKVVT